MEEEVQPKLKELGITEVSGDSAIYSGIRDTILNEIKNIDLNGSFGTKIDTLARHLLWIREHDPGAKSIIFSQYRDFLDVLARAFGQFKIGFTGIDRKDGIQKFKNDPSVSLDSELATIRNPCSRSTLDGMLLPPRPSTFIWT